MEASSSMGGIAYSIELEKAPADPEARQALLASTWGIIQRRIDSLAKRKGTRDITGFYLRMQASDGMADGGWFASDAELHFRFGDAAGLCYGEMGASWHWTELVTLEMWDVIAERAAARGAVLKKPKRTLEEALASNRTLPSSGERTSRRRMRIPRRRTTTEFGSTTR